MLDFTSSPRLLSILLRWGVRRSVAAISLFAVLLNSYVAWAQAPNGERRWLESPPSPSYSHKRIALVIGNTHYGGANSLKNPENDARSMAHTLQALGFDVYMCLDQTAAQMEDDILEFGKRAVEANVALVYYSGHGSQVSGANYLIPVGFDGHSESDIKYHAVNSQRIFNTLAAGTSHINIVIFDACRDNPFAKSTRSQSRGLAPVHVTGGTLISYATAPGQTAEDNPDGANGLFTQELLRRIKTPGISIEDVFKSTRKAVREASAGKQVPWQESSLEDDFYFVPLPSGNAKPLPPPAVNNHPVPPPSQVDTLPPVSDWPSEPKLDFVGHTGHVTAATYSPDGRFIVTASDDTTAIIWNAATGQQVRTLAGNAQSVLYAVFSPNNQYVLTAHFNGTAKLWDASNGELIRTLRGHTGWVRLCAFSPDSRTIVTACGDKTARVWDTATGSLIRIIDGHSGFVPTVKFSPDGRYIATGSGDNTAKVWNAVSGSLVYTMSGHRNNVESVGFSPNSRYLVTGSWDYTARVWDLVNGGTLVHILIGHTAGITCASFSPDGRFLVTSSDDGTARIWETDSYRLVHVFKVPIGKIQSALFSPDSRHILMAGTGNTVQIWDVPAGKGRQ